MTKPRLYIVPDGDDGAYHWVGVFPGGWSTLGRIATMPVAEAIKFYCRVLRYDLVSIANHERRRDLSSV